MTGRPPATAPRGRVTLAEAAEISGLSRQEIHRRISEGQLEGQQDPASGAWTITRHSAEQLTRKAPAKGPRRAVMLRPYLPRYRAWELAAKKRGVSVGQLAGMLMDEAAVWEDGEE